MDIFYLKAVSSAGSHVGQMFEVTVDLCNIFHIGCLSVGNVRHGYTKQSQGFFFSKANWWKKMSGLVLTEIENNLWAVFGQEQS